MNVLIAVFKDLFAFIDPRSRRGKFIVVGLVLVAGAAYYTLAEQPLESTSEDTSARAVSVASANQYSGQSTITFIGSVESVSEARLESEASGRVTSVTVEIGDRVSAGTIVAQLENESQYANLLQAEGAYESAVAGAAQSDVGVVQAEQAVQNSKRSALTTYRGAFSTVQNAVYTTIDQYFSTPAPNITALRIDGGSQTRTMNSLRATIETTVTDFEQQLPNTTTDTVASELPAAEAAVNQVISLIDLLINRLNDTKAQDAFTDAELRSAVTELSSLRSNLINTATSLSNAENAIVNAEDSLEQAEIGGSGSDVSAADAQIKQALGRLRAAQAEYRKTIIRTPIAGEITELEVNSGDFIGVRSPVATISNTDALEITAFIGETEKNQLTVGDTVTIENQFEGRVSAIASALNQATKKTEIKIQTDTTEIASGDSVRISIDQDTAPSAESSTGPILIPITAVKFTATAGSVFLVTEDGTLESRSVSLGPVQGNYIVIEDGIDAATEFVVDARGLSEGTAVEVIQN